MPRKLHLSPSQHHHRLMKDNPPTLSFDGGDFRPWRRKLRRRVIECLGDRPQEKPPLRPVSLWKRSHPLGTIEKIAFQAEPGCDVTAYLCLPSKVEPPYTIFICLQGHSTGAHNSIAVDREDETLFIPPKGDRDFGVGCMKRGIAALCVEQRSFGERRERTLKHPASNGCQDATGHALILGRTLVGERVYDVERSIDYLETRKDIDLERIGVMGNSGGGTVSLFAAATIDRIAFAMPSCYFCTFHDSIMSIGHCLDNYLPGLLKYAEMADVMGLFAPKPVVIVAGREDPIFPIRGTRSAFGRLRQIYASAGAPDACKLIIGPEGHRFYADHAWPAMEKYLAH